MFSPLRVLANTFALARVQNSRTTRGAAARLSRCGTLAPAQRRCLSIIVLCRAVPVAQNVAPVEAARARLARHARQHEHHLRARSESYGPVRTSV
eukprot:5423644-Pleurochrysis_carterae.AAC.1